MGGNWTIGQYAINRMNIQLTCTTVGLAPATFQRGFGQEADSSVKYKLIQLIASVRTVMRGRSLRATSSMHCLVGVVMANSSFPWLAVPLIIINTLIIVYELILG